MDPTITTTLSSSTTGYVYGPARPTNSPTSTVPTPSIDTPITTAPVSTTPIYGPASVPVIEPGVHTQVDDDRREHGQ